MGDLLLAILLGVVFTLFGMSLFPTINAWMRAIDTTGMFPLLAAGIRSMPYVVMVIVVWTAIQIVKHKVNH
jgi:hypothetical protein